ncbi:signal peptidase I [Halorubellus sp. JP-L1]|uniref:signal peptidase I n=1 Tax=Halorubellus sp. JP-L1 TaxID=2715753 RepID=UPI001407AB28|nr:signal peptidase I [Halorubellus sp. JP-L1]NHN41807.1 signal peptidase I [Halorubellus sp. JP-L1]
MDAKRLVAWSVEAVAVVVLLSLVVGGIVGQPVLLGYVETGSMSPTLDAGDGFVAVPQAIAGSVDEGDVVTFRAKELHGGGLTTHRVVEETPRGYVTRGDANPFTDQDGAEPLVKEPQVVAQALQVNGRVVAIPHLGTAVETASAAVGAVQAWIARLTGSESLLGTQGVAYLVFAASALVYAFDVFVGGGSGRSVGRSRARGDGVSARLVVLALVAVVVASATAAMVVPSGVHEHGVVSAETDGPGPGVIPAGERENATVALGNGGFVPTHVFLEPASEGVSVTPERTTLDARSQTNATVIFAAPPETGYYRRYVAEYRYLAVLPRSTVATMHAVHPWLPVVVVDALLGASFYALASALVGRGRVRSQSRDAPTNATRLLNRLT